MHERIEPETPSRLPFQPLSPLNALFDMLQHDLSKKPWGSCTLKSDYLPKNLYSGRSSRSATRSRPIAYLATSGILKAFMTK